MGIRQGAFAATVVALLFAAAPVASGEEQTTEQTRATYKAAVEPICKAKPGSQRTDHGRRQEAGRRRGGRRRSEQIHPPFELIGKHRAAAREGPAADHRRSPQIRRWVQIIRPVEARVRLVGKYYDEGLETKGNQEAALAETHGLSANNTTMTSFLSTTAASENNRSG